MHSFHASSRNEEARASLHRCVLCSGAVQLDREAVLRLLRCRRHYTSGIIVAAPITIVMESNKRWRTDTHISHSRRNSLKRIPSKYIWLLFAAGMKDRLICLLMDDILACPVNFAIFRISFIDLSDARSYWDSAPIIKSIHRLQWLPIVDGETGLQ